MANPRGNPRFVKGVSGNPSGRPKLDPAFKALLEDNTIEALNTVIELMKSKSTSSNVRLDAAIMIIERVYGKANQPLSNPDGTPLTFHLVNYAKCRQ